MASHNEDDFEMIDAPLERESTNLPIREPCGDSHRSHASWEAEVTSERAIEPLLALMEKCAKDLETKRPFFHTSIGSTGAAPSDKNAMIFDAFCTGVPAEKRWLLNCTACKRFLRQHGDMCVVGDKGELIPLIWPQDISTVPQYYKQSVENVLKLFRQATLRDEFVPEQATIGTPQTGEWHHMTITFSSDIPRASSSFDLQDTQTSYKMLERVLVDNSAANIARVYHLITEDQLPYATSHKAPVKYLKDTAKKLDEQGITFPFPTNPVPRRNLITKYARSAFPGCLSSLRGGMIGYLFECVREGQDFEAVKRNWITKAGPLNYMRPTSAPSTGNIESAEKIFARLGYTTNDLERDFLSMDQIPESAILWSPAPPHKLKVASENSQLKRPVAPKLFSHLLPDKTTTSPTRFDDDAPLQDISFRQFTFKILPNASKILILPDDPIKPYFFTTGKRGSKPIMSFHQEGSHTASWYTWGSKCSASNANLKREWTPVTNIVTFPHMWDHFSTAIEALDDTKAENFKFKRHGIRFLFCLEGAKEKMGRELCLFPTLMRGEFHGVRKTVEAFSNSGKLGTADGTICIGGESIEKNESKNLVLGVQTKEGQVSQYRIVLFE